MSRICVYGAGSIGCYVGGRLAAAGAEVLLIGRERIGRELLGQGLHLTDLHGTDIRLPATAIRFASEARAAADAALVLIAVKSGATAEVGRELAPVLAPGSVVISLQNGLGNAELLRQALPRQTVLSGMVPFNVVHRGPGAFHQGSEGELEVQCDAALAPFAEAFRRAGLPLLQRSDMRSVLWAKLLLNLNNPINALSNLPLKTELSQRAFRRCVALAQREALQLMDAAGIRPAKLTPLPPHWVPRLLSVPDALFRRLANRMLEIDPLARSSMWEDLQAGRPTEIDWINGEVLKLAAQLQRRAPVNAKLVALIRAAEQGGRRDWSGEELLQELAAVGGAG
jgi:2-dehydropantoate 2-reductase